MTYAIDAAADVVPVDLRSSLDGLTFDARTPRGTVHIESRMVGRANAYNILAAVAAAAALDLPLPAIEAGIAKLHAVPGRFQLVSDSRDDVRVVVDYAHTDDALKNLLETARPLATGPHHHGVRLRRRSRSHQAAADGRRGGAAERRRGRDLRQSALRESRRTSSSRSSAASSRPTIAARADRAAVNATCAV